MQTVNLQPTLELTGTPPVSFMRLLSGEQRQTKMKLLKRIWRVMFPSHPLPCSHKWKRDGELYVKCEKCGELAVYIGGQR